MNGLLSMLPLDRPAIEAAFRRRVQSGRCPAPGQDAETECRAVLDALMLDRKEQDETAVALWARRWHDQPPETRPSYADALSVLHAIEEILRLHAVKSIQKKRVLVLVLEELSARIDTLRRAYSDMAGGPADEKLGVQNVFSALAESSEECIILADLHGRPLYLNRAGRRLTGLADDASLHAVRLHDFYTDDTWVELRDIAVPGVKQHGHWEGRCDVRAIDSGDVFSLDTRIFLVRQTPGQRPSCLAIVHRKTSDVERLHDALNECQARKHAILESSIDPIITIDSRGVVTEFNRAAEQVFGYNRDDVLGTDPSEILFPPDKSEGHQNRIDRYLRAGEGSLLGKRVEVTALRANGESFPAELAMTISQEQGEPLLTFFVRDISQRKRAEEEQARYARELERSNAELEQFAYVASHDLQEPLRKIRTFGDRLQMRCGDALDDVGRECLTRMQDAAVRMQSLINGLLTLSRVATKGQEFAKVDLARVAAEVVNDLEVQIERVGGRVEVGKLPTIQGDEFQLRQLLQNLIGNALKFHRPEEPPVVRVEGRFLRGRTERSTGNDKDERCEITVEDNGIGFDEKYLDRIFGVFQRLHSRDVYEGTGVGLAICRKIAERHGGTLTARSEPGKGSTFVAVLPVFQPKAKG